MTRSSYAPRMAFSSRGARLPELPLGPQNPCLVLITLGAAAIRILHLTSQGLNLDEGFSAYLGRTTAAEFVATAWNSEFNMVLYYALLRAWMHLGHSEFVIRLLSVLFAAATVPAVYFLARRLFPDGWTPLVASVLIALHPFHVTLSQSARSYSLVILLVTLASLFFLRALRNPSATNFTVYAFFCAAAVYSHFFALLVLLSHAVALAFLPETLPWKGIVAATALTIALLLPFGFFVLRHGSTGHVSWVMPLHQQQVLDTLYALTLSKWRSLTYVVAWIAALAAAVRSPREAAWPFRFTATWLLLPILTTLAVSLWRPLLVERYLSVCIPACVLLAAAGGAIIARWSRAAALALLLLTVFYSASNIRHYMRHPEYGENWREASAYLLSQAQAGDEVVLLPGLGPPTFDYYRERNPHKISGLLFADSAAAPLPVPPPESVWFIGSVLLTPSWAGEADAFRQTRSEQYCPQPAQPEAGSVRVWQFKRCDKGAKSPEGPPPTVR